MWTSEEGLDVVAFVIETDRICEMKTDVDGWLKYRFRTPSENYKSRWNSLTELPTAKFRPTGSLCYWYDHGPHFLVTDVDGYSRLFAHGRNVSEIFQFQMDYELSAYDYVEDKLYFYTSGALYTMSPTEFLDKVQQSESNGVRLELTGPPVHRQPNIHSESWDDLMVMNGTIYYLIDGFIYEWRNNREYPLSRINTDHFTYVLIPTYEDDSRSTNTTTPSVQPRGPIKDTPSPHKDDSPVSRDRSHLRTPKPPIGYKPVDDIQPVEIPSPVETKLCPCDSNGCISNRTEMISRKKKDLDCSCDGSLCELKEKPPPPPQVKYSTLYFLVIFVVFCLILYFTIIYIDFFVRMYYMCKE